MNNFLQNKVIYLVFAVFTSMLIAQLGYFQSFFLTREIQLAEFVHVSPLALLFFISVIDVLLLQQLSKVMLKDKYKNRQKFVQFAPWIYYMSIFIGGLVTISIIRFIYDSIGMTFKVEALFNTSFYDVFWFILFINIFISYLLFTLFTLKKINDFNVGFKQKLKIISILLLFLSILIIILFDIYFALPLILSFMIYIFVLDIYMDKQMMNSTWSFTFMILIAGFTSLIIFSGYTRQLNSKRILEINNSLFLRDFNLESEFNDNKFLNKKYKDYYIETDTLEEELFLEKINAGYYKIENSKYFNPRIGNYILLDSKIDNELKYVVRNIYNKISKSPSKNIIFYKNRVVSNNTIYERIPFPENSQLNDSITEYIVDGLSFISYRYNSDLMVIDIKKIPGILMPFSLFSLLFVFTGLLFFLISIFNSRFNFLPEMIRITFKGIKSLRDRIQFSIIGIVIISFFILGIITFYYIIDYSEQYQKDNALLYSNVLFKEINNEKLIDKKYIHDKLLLLEKEQGRSLYYYDISGNLVDDVRRKIVDEGKSPLRKIKVDKLGDSNFIRLNKNNNLLYSIIPILNNKNVDGFVVSYFTDNNSIIEASGVLSNFLNVYVLLFLISGAIAIALANSISKPIDILGSKLEMLELGEINKELKWDKQDEIGKLISIYNKTVKKLEESAKIITKIERDSAWREMAKQVAHEIKNPLTPLKLNIQYLQGVVKSNPDRVVDMVKQIAPSLIEQINNLDKIATEFADFAKMPTARNEKIKLNEIVKAVHDFFRKREDLDIQLYVPINDLVIFADKNHLVSILNNIIKNAIQSIPTNRLGKIKIDLYKDNDNAIVKITDNGSGIPEEMKTKVFSPNFTTKSSGTGLGLAISTNMIQAFNGKIYFETKLDFGTSFFVEIPLMRLTDNFPEQKRVSLDD